MTSLLSFWSFGLILYEAIQLIPLSNLSIRVHHSKTVYFDPNLLRFMLNDVKEVIHELLEPTCAYCIIMYSYFLLPVRL